MSPYNPTVKRPIASRGVLLGAAVLLSSCEGDPEPGTPWCFVQDGPNWQVKYDLLEAPAQQQACAATGLPPGERLQVVAQASETGDRQLALYWSPEVSKPEVRTYVPASALLAREPDAQRLCGTEAFTVGGSGPPRFDANPPDPSAWPIQFRPSNVKVYMPPDGPGNQLSGELSYTEDGCTWRYAMRAIYPAVTCDPALDPADPANAARTCGAGSGIDPAMAVVCDAQLSACVPASPIPSLK